MDKKLLAPIVAIVALLAIGGVIALNSKKTAAPQNNATETSTPAPRPAASDTPAQQAQPSANPAAPEGQAAAVTIENFAFGPKALTVKKGTKVTWTNQDTTQHSVVGKGFESEMLGKGDSYSFTFSQAGTFDYVCGPHPDMKATVQVTD